jgi:NAD(P)-dependent dehydrogenase (short-subunit alcohol dehydrogenase family)
MGEKFEGKVALVTGGSSGIGRASAIAFAREGAKVVIADITIKGGEETVHMIKKAGGEGIFVETDVSNAAAVEAMVDKIVGVYSRLDFAFNNAGIGGSLFVPTADYSEEHWDKVIDINLKGVWLCMKYEIRQMLKQGGGAIVNTSSGAGLVGSRFVGPAYTASKHGVLGLTKTAALEYARNGIRVNAVCPSTIRTPMGDDLIRDDPRREAELADRLPIGRWGTPEEVAEAVVWLCSTGASFVTGHAIAIDGGFVAQ